MSTEMTKAAQQALEALEQLQGVCTDERGGVEAITVWTPEAIDALRAALAQRPAAQEVDGVPEHLIPRIIKGVIESAAQRRATQPAHQQATPDHVPDAGNMVQATPEPCKSFSELYERNRAGVDAELAAMAAEATPEPVTLGPLAQRNIYDAIRSAYDLGYNDARNARTVPGDSAPGYKGRDVEADHGGALFNTLARRLRSAATPEPVGEPVAWRISSTGEDDLGSWLDEHAPGFDPKRDGVPHLRYEPLYTRPAAAPAVPEGFTLHELHELERAIEDFIDCGETDVDDKLLMRGVQAGFLECTNYLAADREALRTALAAAQANGEQA